MKIIENWNKMLSMYIYIYVCVGLARKYRPSQSLNTSDSATLSHNCFPLRKNLYLQLRYFFTIFYFFYFIFKIHLQSFSSSPLPL